MAKKTSKKKVAKKVVKKKSSPTLSKTTMLKVGDLAPAFTLLDQNGQEVSLSDFKGQKVVVYFYPRAMTPGCTVQACGLRDSSKQLKNLKIVALGISADPVKKLKQFEEKQDLNFLLLSDPDHVATKAYGSWGLKKFMGREFEGILRQSFLINEKGIIVHVMDKVNTSTHHSDVLEVFKNL
jgi:peroxiredoxin Q/BCP